MDMVDRPDRLESDLIEDNDDASKAAAERYLVERAKELSDGLTIATETKPIESNGLYTEVILLTGSTGSLGAALLAQLLASSTTKRVYALVRKSSPTVKDGPTMDYILERQCSTFVRAGFDANALDSALQIGKLLFVSDDLSHSNLKLDSPGLLESMREEVTCILHCAWTVDFKRSVTSFDQDLTGC